MTAVDLLDLVARGIGYAVLSFLVVALVWRLVWRLVEAVGVGLLIAWHQRKYPERIPPEEPLVCHPYSTCHPQEPRP